MDQAVGSKIADYLIKPVNPNQILIAIKSTCIRRRWCRRRPHATIAREFGELGSLINTADSIDDWYSLYERLVFREMELAGAGTNMDELLAIQKKEANSEFYKWVKRNYSSWMDSDGAPADESAGASQDSLPDARRRRKRCFSYLSTTSGSTSGVPSSPCLPNISISTKACIPLSCPRPREYARNAIFSGLMPAQIENVPRTVG